MLTISLEDFRQFELLKEAARRESAGLPALSANPTTISLGDGSFLVSNLNSKVQTGKLFRLWQLY